MEMTLKEFIDFHNQSSHDSIVITGPTASGKTKLAVNFARAFNGEVISADSRQVYRSLDLGTGKDLCDYEAKGTLCAVKYHLIDVVDLSERFNVYRYVKLFEEVLKDIQSRKKLPIVAGGTGLYIDAVVRGYNYGGRGDKRVTKGLINPSVLAVKIERAVLRQRIRARLIERLDAGMEHEVKSLLEKYGKERLLSLGLEYRYVTMWLCGQINSREDLIDTLSTKIAQFAKRQETFLRYMSNHGVEIVYVKPEWE